MYQLKVSVNPLLPPPADVELTGRMTESSLRHEPTEVTDTDRAYRCSAHMIPVNWGVAGKDWEGGRRLLVCQHYKLVVLLSADSSTLHTAAVCVAELFASYAQCRWSWVQAQDTVRVKCGRAVPSVCPLYSGLWASHTYRSSLRPANQFTCADVLLASRLTPNSHNDSFLAEQPPQSTTGCSGRIQGHSPLSCRAGPLNEACISKWTEAHRAAALTG